MASPIKFAHVVYSTHRFDDMLDWYQKVFEAKIVYKNPALAFLTYDDEHHRFALANLSILNPASTASRSDAVGVNHVAYTYANLGDLLSTYERLKGMGVLPYWRIHHGMTLSLYYRDPDGNRMEFQIDTCSVKEANEYMQTEAFAANPIGVEIDPRSFVGPVQKRCAGGAANRFSKGRHFPDSSRTRNDLINNRRSAMTISPNFTIAQYKIVPCCGASVDPMH